MKKSILALAVVLVACTAAGGLKPSVATFPPSYLESFPLGSVSEAELLAKVGPPDQILELAGRRSLVYRLGEGAGLRSFTYVMDGGIVTDVLYNDNGPYNGSTARRRQGK